MSQSPCDKWLLWYGVKINSNAHLGASDDFNRQRQIRQIKPRKNYMISRAFKVSSIAAAALLAACGGGGFRKPYANSHASGKRYPSH